MAPRIQRNDWVFLKMPSGNTKLVQLSEEIEVIELGKFGSFKAKDLIGQYFGISLQIHDNGLCRYIKPTVNFDDNGNNNQFLYDDKTSQLLSQTEIEQMKSDNHSSIIEEIVKNNQQFASKTSYSQAKYIKRKISKFSKHFCPMEVNVVNLLDYYRDKNWAKIMGLRIDSLSQILTYSNVHHKSRLIVCDDTAGLLGLALLERINSGTLYFIHDGACPNLDLLKYGKLQRYHCYPWYRFNTPLVYLEPKFGSTEKSLSKYQSMESEHAELLRGGFDGLIIASKFDPSQIIKKLLPLLNASSPIVCYSPYKEVSLTNLGNITFLSVCKK